MVREPRILMMYGGWKGHTPLQSCELMATALTEQGAVVRLVSDLSIYENAAYLAQFDAICQCVTQSSLTTSQEAGLLNAVMGGIGFCGWHGGIIDSYRSSVNYQWMTGGQWVAHPGDLIDFRVEIAADHEITHGIEPFTLNGTEQYYVHIDPGAHVICCTAMSAEGNAGCYRFGIEMPAAWTKTWGRGRVFAACWGHTYRDFEVYEAREIMRRGILWSARAI